MKVHDLVTVGKYPGRISKILPSGDIEVTLEDVIDTAKGESNVVVCKSITSYRRHRYK